MNGSSTSPASQFTMDAAQRLSHYYQVDSERQAFIHSVLERIEADAKRINDLELDLEDQKRSRAAYQGRSISLQQDLQLIDQRLNQDAFVVVLVDGDGAKFADEHLQDPIEGAERAAQRLKQAVRDSLKDTPFGHDGIPVVARVYANLNDLSKALRLSYIINSDEEMRVFAERFTNSRADFDFINVGKGKENADSKMRRMLNHYYKNVQCKKIFLAGCCHDNGYLHDLRDYQGVAEDKLVLIETTTAEPGFRNLGFPVIRFDSVFRSLPLNNENKRIMSFPIGGRSPPQQYTEPLPPIARPASFSRSSQPSTTPSPIVTKSDPRTTPISPPLETSPTPPPLAAVQRVPSNPANPSKAPARTTSIVSSGNGGTSINYANAAGTNDHQNVTLKAPKPKKQPKVIFYNDDNYRIDPPTQHPPKTPAQQTYQAKFASIKPLVFCNDFYLKGRCKWGVNCDKTHDAELTPPELAIHRYKARTSLCPAGPYCVDYDCYLSHHCPRDPCARNECPFQQNKNKWGDLHLNKAQLQPATKWTEGIDIPEHLY